MPNESMLSPLNAAVDAAEHFENPLAKSVILSAVAQSQFAAGQFAETFATVVRIPNRAEKKSTLLALATDFIAVQPPLPETVIVQIIETLIDVEPKSNSAAGRFAQLLLESGNISAALALLDAVEKPFDTDRNREIFVTTLMETGGEEYLVHAQKLNETLEDADYRDRGRLELCKYLAKWNRIPEAEVLAESFSSPQRRSWAFFELSRTVPEDKSAALWEKSCAVLESVTVNSSNAESIAVQCRIIGKAAFHAGLTERSVQLLERSEAAATSVPVLPQRLKVQYLLAKVLRELGQIDSVENYLVSDEAVRTELTGIQRSELLQWRAEASPPSNDVTKIWSEAVEEAAEPEQKEVDEFTRAERIIEIVRRFSSPKDATPTGDPQSDAVRLCAEEFEEYYYSPFTVLDCNC